MADIQKIKIGTDTPDAIMFDTYYAPIANQDLKLETIIAKDNTSMAENPEGTWEINDDWDVEFIDNGRTIRINKFKIDTWGIRHKVSSSSDNSTKYKNIQCRIEGLTYVNQNIIKSNADSEEVTGFTNAYCGDIGYVVEWYPGQSTSGRFVKGLVIQGQPIYTDTWNNAIDCSYAMGRAPWEVIDVRDQMVTDGIRPVGMMTGGGCSGFCIGIFGGVQNATEHLDNANGAYRVYDISDHPIFIYLDVLDVNANIDASTVECWDAYTETTQIWHKNKTVENCWLKHGIITDTWKDNSIDESPTVHSYYKMDMSGIPSEIENPILPVVTDYEAHILPKNNSNIKPIKWNHKIANPEFWNNIKNYLLTHPIIYVQSTFINSGNKNFSDYTDADNNYTVAESDWFNGAGMTGNLTVKFDGAFESYSMLNWIKDNVLDTLTLQFLQDNIVISVTQNMFRMMTVGTIQVLDKNGNPSSNHLGARDCSSTFEFSSIQYIPDIINWNYRRDVNGVQCVSIRYMCSYCSSLIEFAQHGTDRDDISNKILCLGTAQAFQGCTSLTKIGPILDLEKENFTQNPNINDSGYKMFENCNTLTDVRIANLNGSYVNFDDNTQHGSLPALDAASIQYLFANLKDLTKYDADVINSNINNNFFAHSSSGEYDYYWIGNNSVWCSGITEEDNIEYRVRGIRNVTNARRVAESSNDKFFYTTQAVNTQINISGLQNTDKLVWRSGETETVLTNGQNTITNTSGTNGGFILRQVGTTGIVNDYDHVVNISFIKYYQPTAAKAPSAQLHCPEEWESKITTEMITAANAKQWHIYINGTEKTS